MAQELKKVSIIPPDEDTKPRRNLPAVASPLDIVQAALKSGNVEMYREAVALFKELEGMAARKAFDNAMADAVFPIVKKNREVDFTSSKGRTHYKFEDLAEVLRTVVPVLAENGLSHRFRVTSNVNEPVTVTCIISHRDGYFEETTLCAGRDDSGNKNPIQQVGSTITYLQRMTLKAALGLAASEDDDGRSSEAAKVEPGDYEPPAGSITQEQADNIRDALEAKGASRAAFLQWATGQKFLGGNRKIIEDLPAEHFDGCMNAIAGFRKVSK
jgi:ERF superfamily